MTLLQTWRLIASDVRRISAFTNVPLRPLGWLFFAVHPSIVALAVHRVAHWAYLRRLRPIAWSLYVLNQYLTGADINPASSIGHSCLLAHVNGTAIAGRIGNYATLFGAPGLGGGNGTADAGAGPGLPVVGDRVVIGVRATLLGPIRVGDDCMIGAGSLVLHDVPAGKVVATLAARVVGNRDMCSDYEAIARSSAKLKVAGKAGADG